MPGARAHRVRPSDVEAYIASADPNRPAEAQAAARLDEVLAGHAIEAQRRVECYGKVCKLTLDFADEGEAAKLWGVEPMQGTEFTYTVVKQLGGEVTVTLYRTLPGSTFERTLPGS